MHHIYASMHKTIADTVFGMMKTIHIALIGYWQNDFNELRVSFSFINKRISHHRRMATSIDCNFSTGSAKTKTRNVNHIFIDN